VAYFHTILGVEIPTHYQSLLKALSHNKGI